MNHRKTAAERVRVQVWQSFAGLKIPPADGLLRTGLDERWRDSYERTRRVFAGRSWEDVNAEFLWGDRTEGQVIYAYCYLGTAAFQYYLPPALLACLDEVENSEDHFLPVISSLLTPSYSALCARGVDAALEEQRAAFTAQQNEAVGAFLEFVFDHVPRFRWFSAQALYWGWQQVGGPGVEKVRELYRTHRNYTYELPAEPEAAAIVRELREAFADHPYPGDDQIVTSGCGDEPWEYALEFRGTDWRKLHPEFLARHNASLSFFSDAGFGYFLPAYMQANLCRPDLVDDVVFHLTHGLTGADAGIWEDLEERVADKSPEIREAFAQSKQMFDEFREQTAHIDWRSHAVQRFKGLDAAERQAVARYLQFVQSRDEGLSRETIREALRGYWLREQSP